jgi:hypothetical protein
MCNKKLGSSSAAAQLGELQHVKKSLESNEVQHVVNFSNSEQSVKFHSLQNFNGFRL